MTGWSVAEEFLMKKKFSRIIGQISILLMGWLCGCDNRSQPTIHIGINPWPGYEFLHLAKTKGYFTDEGVNVRLVELGSAGDVRRAFERGQLDGFSSTVMEVLQVNNHKNSKRRAQIVYVIDYSAGGDVILAHPPIADVAGLKGKRIGVSPASITLFVVARALEIAGLSVDDVTLVSMDQLSMPAAFEAGDVDAVATYPPTSVVIRNDLKCEIVFTSKEIPREVVDVLSFEAKLIVERPGDIAKIIRAFNRALEFS